MEDIDYWRFCEALNVIQAALLIVGEDPSKSEAFIEKEIPLKRPKGYDAVKAALMHDILSKKLHASIRRVSGTGGYYDDAKPNPMADLAILQNFPEHKPDLTLTTINVEDLKAWLLKRGISTGFFFPQNDAPPRAHYLDASHPHYSKKLAAAVEAWQSVTDDASLLKSKKPKQAVEKWLRLNAQRFGLFKEDGTFNEEGIEQISKVVNWETKGGAPKQ